MFESLLRPRGANDAIQNTVFAPWVCIQFSADWCGPCQRINKNAYLERTPGIQWYYCDVDQNETSFGFCGLRAIPSFALIRDGTFVARVEGPRDAGAVLQWLAQNQAPIAY